MEIIIGIPVLLLLIECFVLRSIPLIAFALVTLIFSLDSTGLGLLIVFWLGVFAIAMVKKNLLKHAGLQIIFLYTFLLWFVYGLNNGLTDFSVLWIKGYEDEIRAISASIITGLLEDLEYPARTWLLWCIPLYFIYQVIDRKSFGAKRKIAAVILLVLYAGHLSIFFDAHQKRNHTQEAFKTTVSALQNHYKEHAVFPPELKNLVPKYLSEIPSATSRYSSFEYQPERPWFCLILKAPDTAFRYYSMSDPLHFCVNLITNKHHNGNEPLFIKDEKINPPSKGTEVQTF